MPGQLGWVWEGLCLPGVAAINVDADARFVWRHTILSCAFTPWTEPVVGAGGAAISDEGPGGSHRPHDRRGQTVDAARAHGMLSRRERPGIRHVLAHSEVLKHAQEEGKLTVYEAEYQLDTGRVVPLEKTGQ